MRANNCGLALDNQGNIAAWGSDSEGLVSNAPTGPGFVDLDCYGSWVLARKHDGTINGWGEDHSGQIAQCPTQAGFLDIAASDSSGCAVASDGTLLAWGSDLYGQVSNVPSGNGFVEVKAGLEYFVAKRIDGTLVAWGLDSYEAVSDLPTDQAVEDFYVGSHHTQAFLGNGEYGIWGGVGAWEAEMAPVAGDFIAMDSCGANSLYLYTDPFLLAPNTLARGGDIHLRYRSDLPKAWVYQCYSLTGSGPTSVGSYGIELSRRHNCGVIKASYGRKKSSLSQKSRIVFL